MQLIVKLARSPMTLLVQHGSKPHDNVMITCASQEEDEEEEAAQDEEEAVEEDQRCFETS